VRGNAGVQYVRVQQEAEGKAVNGGIITDLRDGATYHDVLPSLNLNFDLGNYIGDTYLRFGAAKTVARPRMSDMRAGIAAGVSQTTLEWNGSGGNPQLQPWRANSYDLSLEHYFNKGSYVSAAYFFKDLKSYIYNQQQAFDFTGFPNPSTVVPISNIGTINRPANGQGGFVRGVELTASHAAEHAVGPPGRLRHPGQRLRHRELDPSERSGHHREAAGPVRRGRQPDRLLREERLLGAHQRTLSLGLPRRSHRPVRPARLQRDPGREADRRAARLRVPGRPVQEPRLPGPGEQPEQPYQTKQGSAFASGAYAPERYTTYGRQVLFGLNYKL
jgi:iron complex outermembrane receptor protein